VTNSEVYLSCLFTRWDRVVATLVTVDFVPHMTKRYRKMFDSKLLVIYYLI